MAALVVRPRRWGAVALVMGMLVLSGCGADEDEGSYAYGVSASELAGEWVSVEPLPVSLSLREDGSFLSSTWRPYLTCPQGNDLGVDDIVDEPAVAISGTWTVEPGEPSLWLPAVALEVADAPCDSGVVLSFVWREHSGALSVCFPLGSAQDPDNFVERTTVMLTRDDVGADSGRPCFD